MRRRFGLFGFIAIVQSVIFLSHLVLYETWVYQTPTFAAQGVQAEWVKWVFAALSISFISATLLARRYNNPALRAFYRAAALWTGLLTFLIAAALVSWAVFAITTLAGARLNFHHVVQWSFAAAF